MLQHVEGGRQTEIDSLNGALLKEAKAVGLACPFNEAAVLAIKAIEARTALRAASPAVDERGLEAAARASPRPRG
jgi:ketopantoate reductase